MLGLRSGHVDFGFYRPWCHDNRLVVEELKGKMGNDPMKIRKIEIEFPLLVELPPGFEQALDRLVDTVCKKYEQENPMRVMWPAGHGNKPIFSQADLAFLGKPPNPDAPKKGEPTWEEHVYQIDVAERMKGKMGG